MADVWFVLSINEQLAIRACKVTSEVFCQTTTVVPKTGYDHSSILSESSMCIFWHFPFKNVPINVEPRLEFLSPDYFHASHFCLLSILSITRAELFSLHQTYVVWRHNLNTPVNTSLTEACWIINVTFFCKIWIKIKFVCMPCFAIKAASSGIFKTWPKCITIRRSVL